MMKTWTTVLTICAVAGAALVMTACDSGEQGRPLNYEKGVYKGKPHTPLSEETLRALRARAAYQGGLATVSSGGFTVLDESSEGSDVRPPGTPLDGR
jgi:hypothetical protein